MHRSFFGVPGCSISPQPRRSTLKLSEVPAVTYDQSAISYRLDALETTTQNNPQSPSDGPQDAPGDCGVDFRHSGWADRRDCVQRALESIEKTENRRNRFDNCGSRAWVMQSVDDPDVYKITCDRCRDRFCQPCATERARHIASCVGKFATDRTIRLVTLTLRQTDTSIGDDVDRIYKAFTKLRRRKLWAKSQKGGVFFIEIKRRRGDDGWHTHLHVLTEGRWIEKRDLSKAWLDVTGDSFIVDVKFCDSGEDAARYVAKYAGKGVHGSCYHDPKILREAIIAIKGRRLVGKWGTWRALDFDADVSDGEWTAVDSLRRLVNRSNNGDAVAVNILSRLKGERPCNTEPRSPPDPSSSPSLFDTNLAVPDVLSSFSLAS